MVVPRAEKGIEAVRAANVSALDKAAKMRRLQDLEKIKVFPNVVQMGGVVPLAVEPCRVTVPLE